MERLLEIIFGGANVPTTPGAERAVGFNPPPWMGDNPRLVNALFILAALVVVILVYQREGRTERAHGPFLPRLLRGLLAPIGYVVALAIAIGNALSMPGVYGAVAMGVAVLLLVFLGLRIYTHFRGVKWGARGCSSASGWARSGCSFSSTSSS